MKIGRLAGWVGVVAMTATLVAACGGGSTTSEPTLQKNNEIVYTLQGTTYADVTPLISLSDYTTTNSQAIWMAWAPLIMPSKSGTIDWADSVAKSVTPNADGSKYVMTLNNWKFSNGKPITVQDVLYDVNLIFYDCNNSSNSALKFAFGGCGSYLPPAPPPGGPAYLTGATAGPGPNQITFTMSGPSNPSIMTMDVFGQINVFPQATWDQGSPLATLNYMGNNLVNTTAKAFSVVSGPYEFGKVVPNQSFEMDPNPNYGGHKASVKMIAYYTNSDAATLAALKKGVANRGGLSQSDYSEAPALQKAGDQVGITSAGVCYGMASITLNGDPHITVGAGKGLGNQMDDLKVRQALQMGMNENALGKIVSGSFEGKPLYFPTYSAVTGGGPATASLVQSIFGTSSISSPFTYNPQGAISLLESDGYHLVNGVMTKSNGEQLSFPIIYETGSTELQDEAVALQSEWKAIGVQVTLQAEPFNTQVQYLDSNPSYATKWAVNWYGGWCNEPNYYGDGYGMWGYYASQGDNSDMQGWSDLAAKMNATYTPGLSKSASQAAMLAYAQATVTDAPVLYQPNSLGVYVQASYIHGFNSAWNPVQAFYQWNYITISH